MGPFQRATLLALLVLAAPAAARDGGRPAASDPSALVEEPVERWSFGPLAFESEPVPCGPFVLATGREASGRRALVVLDAATGRVLSRTLFQASLPLELSASGERVAVRTTPERVDLLRLRNGRLVSERSLAGEAPLSAPHLAGDLLTLREGGTIVRHDLTRREPLWVTRAPWEFQGTPAVRDEHVLAAGLDRDGLAHLAWIDGASGRIRAEIELGASAGPGGPAAAEPRLELHAELAWVHFPAGLRSSGGTPLPWTRAVFDGRRLERLGSLHALLAPPLETTRGWIAPESLPDGRARWVLVEGAPGAERVIELAAPTHHAWLGETLTPPSRAGDVLYLGPAAVDARSLAVLWRRAKAPRLRPVPVPGGLLVVHDDRLQLLAGPSPALDSGAERARELAVRAERALGEELGQLAWRAARAGDGALAGRLVEEAEALGANERTLGLVRTEAERLRSSGERPRAASQALLAEESAMRARPLASLAESARLARDPALRRALLEELFRLAPEHPEGLALLTTLLPRGAPLVPAEARAWLEFLALSALHPLEIVVEPEPGRAPTREQSWLLEERAGWRTDLTAWQSERLVVLTAEAPPDAIARTLRAGELVCDLLEELFGASPAGAERLELLLYPTREEYLAHSSSDLGGFESVLGFTAGHFDLAARASRFFLPSGDDPAALLLGVSTHELTHHWLATRSRFGGPRTAPTASGFWIVEAIATWAEELDLEPARGTWATAPRRAASVDTVASAAPADLLPWREVLQLSFEGYCRLETRPTCTLVLEWQLGTKSPRSPLQLFYAQGAALAHWLYEAEGGRNRALLFRAVEEHYRGRELDLPRALGLTAEELGARVHAWARGLR